MKIIVFGGNGFVGRWLVRRLQEEKISVLCVDLAETSLEERVPYLRADIRRMEDLRAVPMEEDDILVNLVANQYHGKVPRKDRAAYFFDTNTAGAENIMAVALEKGCGKLIQFTTDMVYGKPRYLPVDTEHPQNPFGPYGESKKKTEEICRQYRAKGMNITIFRPRMINGPGRLGILKKLFWLIRHNLPVPTIGSGKNCYQMVSVFDCVSAILLAIQAGVPNDEFNLGSDNPPSTRELLQGLIRRTGSKSIVIPTPGKLVKLTLALLGALGLELMYKEQYMIADENYILDVSKTREKLSWEPKYRDTDMIVEAYQDYTGQTAR